MPVRRTLVPGLSALCIACLGLSLVFVSGCSTQYGPDDARAEQSINIIEGASSKGRNGFSPDPVTVVRKTRVTWTNSDTTEHQIASFSGLFEGQKIKPGETYSFIFSEARSF